jgi:hypothetical protein
VWFDFNVKALETFLAISMKDERIKEAIVLDMTPIEIALARSLRKKVFYTPMESLAEI